MDARRVGAGGSVAQRVSPSLCPSGSNLGSRVLKKKKKKFIEVIPLRVIKQITRTPEMRYDSH